MRKLLLIPAVAVVMYGCASKDEVRALQDALIDVQRSVKELKRENTNLKEMIEVLSVRVDELSQKTAQNSLEIEKLKKLLKQR
ncbi:MAG: hypothetical protein GXO22_06325 [Aquificae bacterium]|nr:hypothetical protein [Aquificota bacterium]